jgi:hypothetical protein
MCVQPPQAGFQTALLVVHGNDDVEDRSRWGHERRKGVDGERNGVHGPSGPRGNYDDPSLVVPC